MKKTIENFPENKRLKIEENEKIINLLSKIQTKI